ncbi:hypothetical protein [Candidatus Coxiella mudrowiae]|uniref:hypothetical protein n=1 Tax=Candidatus Coxiella mudrowiae TaxID=2054173 RepID=UPI00066226ED|nr:hypothetical protein [Candidatus Coxiella mudrowiae]
MHHNELREEETTENDMSYEELMCNLVADEQLKKAAKENTQASSCHPYALLELTTEATAEEIAATSLALFAEAAPAENEELSHTFYFANVLQRSVQSQSLLKKGSNPEKN